ncbi:MAG: response regulator [Humidesulfovibrio sp.]|uniref:response regulator n=1 Tax=Humidesulfovibrio sp. TaxID=2910988 RepID=UPI0027FA8FA8|nr:response regulator [Humidesulfovibrio sp.]MDQ7835861.1 response regulator [Humidesulfovibrio sp.]
MRILIAEDDVASAQYMEGLMARFGDCHVVYDGEEAVSAFAAALEEGRPFQVVCLDIMMPQMNGQEALQQIRALELQAGVQNDHEAKVVMTTALGDVRSVMGAYKHGATAYVTKPILPEPFFETLRNLGISNST